MRFDPLQQVSALTGRAADITQQASGDLASLFDEIDDLIDREEAFKQKIEESYSLHEEVEQSAAKLVFNIHQVFKTNVRKLKEYHEDELEKILRKHQNEAKKMTNVVDSLKSELNTAQEETAVLRVKHDILKTQITDLETLRETEKSLKLEQNKRHEDDLKVLKKDYNEELRKVTKQHEEHVQQMTHKFQTETQEINNRVSNLNTEKCNAQKEIIVLTEENRMLKNKIKTLELLKENDEANRHRELEYERDLGSHLHSQVCRLREKADILLYEIEESKRENVRLVILEQRKSEKAAMEIENLRRKLKDQALHEARYARSEELEAKIEYLKDTITDLKKDSSQWLNVGFDFKDY